MAQTIKEAVRAPSMSDDSEIDVSVVIALINHGGHWEESINSWVREQDYPRGKYEVVIVSERRCAGIEAAVRSLLTPQDSLVFCDRDDEMEAYNLGARLARGKYLFIAEAHSVGQPNCLSAMMKYLIQTGRPGGMCNSFGTWTSYVGGLQEVYFQEEAKSFASDSDWHRIMLRGSAVLRSIYLEYGGFPAKYSTFGYKALDIDLFRNGVRLGYVVDSVIKHHNVSGFRHLDFATREGTYGECAYRNDHSEIHCAKFIGDSKRWRNRFFSNRRVAHLCYYALRQVIWSRLCSTDTFTSAVRTLPELTEFKLLELFGAKWILLKARVIRRIWKTGVQVGNTIKNEKLTRRCFYDFFYVASVAFFEAEYIAKNPPPLKNKRRLLFPMHEELEDHLVGFYPMEKSDTGEFYRFTQPVSVLNFALPVGNYVLAIEDAGCRPAYAKANVIAFLNTFQLEQLPETLHGKELRFKVCREQFSGNHTQHLVIITDCFKPSRYGSPDTRRLGIPITKVEFRPALSSVAVTPSLAVTHSPPTLSR